MFESLLAGVERLRRLVEVSLRIGLGNIARVLLYRIGFSKSRTEWTSRNSCIPILFRQSSLSAGPMLPEPHWLSRVKHFGHAEFLAADQMPEWNRNPFNGVSVHDPARNWWEINDFDEARGDIKAIWEASRFGWVPVLAQESTRSGGASLARLNDWLVDWWMHNTPYKGVNWKCGQEASIRVMHLAAATLILDQVEDTEPALLDLVELHLRRIAPTIGYAIAQDNNHGTSEAAALFIGGSWLERNRRLSGRQWAKLGRKWLENRAAKLIASDGTFSQYSVNYHRVMLDTYSIAEIWRRKLGMPAFSPGLLVRLAAAEEWLRALVDPITGDAPNLGANDGARLLPLTDTDYRDFRQSVQLASMLFLGRRAYSSSASSDAMLDELGILNAGRDVSPPIGTRQFDQGGIARLARSGLVVFMRYPRFRFRPSQADALHVDLWRNSENLLRDGGSYSYADAKWHYYFSGTESHNTVQFDDRDQMPRLGRFIFGDWLETDVIEPLKEGLNSVSFGAGYRDRKGASHLRRVCLLDDALRVEDEVAGFRRRAVLRWRLTPEIAWRLDGNAVVGGGHGLSVTADVPVRRIELVEGWESRYYMLKTPLQVLEVEVDEPAKLVSEFRWQA